MNAVWLLGALLFLVWMANNGVAQKLWTVIQSPNDPLIPAKGMPQVGIPAVGGPSVFQQLITNWAQNSLASKQ